MFSAQLIGMHWEFLLGPYFELFMISSTSIVSIGTIYSHKMSLGNKTLLYVDFSFFVIWHSSCDGVSDVKIVSQIKYIVRDPKR